MTHSLASKDQLAAMAPEDIARSLSTTELATLGALSIVKHVLECREDRASYAAHNAWVSTMSGLGILKEFEND